MTRLDTDTSAPVNWPQVQGLVVQGHQVASGQAADSPYPAGSIAMQMPIFKALGLDLGNRFAATLNVSIQPLGFRLVNPKITFEQVTWTDKHPPETFSFTPCRVLFGSVACDSWLYYPHPGTKQRHFQDQAVLEILAPFIPGLSYGSTVTLAYDPQALILDGDGPESRHRCGPLLQ